MMGSIQPLSPPFRPLSPRSALRSLQDPPSDQLPRVGEIDHRYGALRQPPSDLGFGRRSSLRDDTTSSFPPSLPGHRHKGISPSGVLRHQLLPSPHSLLSDVCSPDSLPSYSSHSRHSSPEDYKRGGYESHPVNPVHSHQIDRSRAKFFSSEPNEQSQQYLSHPVSQYASQKESTSQFAPPSISGVPQPIAWYSEHQQPRYPSSSHIPSIAQSGTPAYHQQSQHEETLSHSGPPASHGDQRFTYSGLPRAPALMGSQHRSQSSWAASSSAGSQRTYLPLPSPGTFRSSRTLEGDSRLERAPASPEPSSRSASVNLATSLRSSQPTASSYQQYSIAFPLHDSRSSSSPSYSNTGTARVGSPGSPMAHRTSLPSLLSGGGASPSRRRQIQEVQQQRLGHRLSYSDLQATGEFEEAAAASTTLYSPASSSSAASASFKRPRMWTGYPDDADSERHLERSACSSPASLHRPRAQSADRAKSTGKCAVLSSHDRPSHAEVMHRLNKKMRERLAIKAASTVIVKPSTTSPSVSGLPQPRALSSAPSSGPSTPATSATTASGPRGISPYRHPASDDGRQHHHDEGIGIKSLLTAAAIGDGRGRFLSQGQ